MGEENEKLTAEETEQMETDPTETPAEAHRYGEFRELRDMIEALDRKVDGIVESVSALKAVDIDNGAEYTEPPVDADENDDGAVIIPDLKDLDFNM